MFQASISRRLGSCSNNSDRKEREKERKNDAIENIDDLKRVGDMRSADTIDWYMFYRMIEIPMKISD